MELFSIRIQRTFQLVSTHNDLVFIVYGAILRRYYKAVGYSTVEQPPKKDRKRQNEIKEWPETISGHS